MATLNSAAPQFSLASVSNERVSLDDFKGKVVLINFWASWCKPCRTEIPELQNIYKKYQNKGLHILGINIDKEKHNAQRFLDTHDVSYTLAFDPQLETINRYGAVAMPCSYLVDKKGVIRSIMVGFSEQKKQKLVKHINHLLEN